MTNIIPQYYTGQRLANVKLTPLVVSATGGFTKGTSYDLATAQTIDEAVFDCDADLAEISGANAGMRNNVLIKDDFTVELTEIAGRNGQTFVLNGWATHDYFLIEVNVSPDGGTTSGLLLQAVCIRASLRPGYSEGKSTMVLTGKACGLPMAFIQNGGATVY